MVPGRTDGGGKLERVFVTLHSLPAELQETIIVATKHGASKIKNSHDVALAPQKTARLKKKRLYIRRKLISLKRSALLLWSFWSSIILLTVVLLLA